MQVGDLERMTVLEQLSVAPDGSAAVVVSTMEFTDDRYVRRIVVVDRQGMTTRLTRGPFDTRPRWSPDGSQIAFLRRADRETEPQVAVIELSGGEAETITSFPLGASDLSWSPDGSRLVVAGVEWTDDEEADRAARPRRITSLPYRADNSGWTHDRRTRLWLVDPSMSAQLFALTDGLADETRPVWSPDGTKVAFLADRTRRMAGSDARQIWEIEVASGTLLKRADLGYWTALGYRPDGVLHAVGIDEFDDWPAPLALWRAENDGWINLTAHLDRMIPAALTDLTWAGSDAVLLVEDRGSTQIVRVEPSGIVHHLTRGDLVVSGCGAASATDGIVYIATTMTDPGEVHRMDLGGRAESVSTEFNAGFRAEVRLVEGHHFEVLSGGIEVDAWTYLPSGDEKVPLLLTIHGGPAAQYGVGFFDEFQVYVAAGYGVVACNPRGSSGRGAAFLKAVTGDGWGTVDLEDLQAVVEAAIERFPRLDATRLAVAGGSYGGFLTAWLTAHDSRFRTAIVERGLLSWPSFAGTSDIGSTFPTQYLGTAMPEGASRLWAKSPLSLAHQVETPTLILHSEQDLRCPISQAEEYFTALLLGGTRAEFVRFPGESHELSRSGSPRLRRERFLAILDWLAATLVDEPPSGGEGPA